MTASPFGAILFDLDGTLLQVEMRRFIPRYIGGFHHYCRDLVGLEELQLAMRSGIRLLLETEDGGCSNEERLFAFVAAKLNLDPVRLQGRFADFLDQGLETLADAIRPIPGAAALVDLCRRAEVALALATNPVFPRVLVEARCRWGGLDVDMFDLVSCFENSRFCKPQAGYFFDVASELGVRPERCLMIGNDTSHDLAATRAGMTTWLVDTYLLERDGPTWEPDYRGDHGSLQRFLAEKLPG